MWLKKYAENKALLMEDPSATDETANYLAAVELIQSKTGVTDQEIEAYYNEAIENAILDYGSLSWQRVYCRANKKYPIGPPDGFL